VVAVAGPELFNSGFQQGLGTTFSHTFTELGTYDIQCAVHLTMIMMAIVVNAPEQDPVVGGTLIAIDKTALLLAGVQSISMWMIPVVVAGIGIGVFVIKQRK